MQRRLLLMIYGLVLLVTMGISSLIPVLPLIASAFGLPPEDAWGVIVAFAVPGLIGTPFVGVWADRYGRKAVLVPALALFALGGLACLLAQSYGQLLFCRLLQGAGSAPLGLLYPTIIADAWQGEERVRAMSRAATMLGLGTAIGPALGGALAMLHWRLPFLLPLLALPVLCLALGLPLMRPGKRIALAAYLRDAAAIARKPHTLLLLALTLLTFTLLSGPIITCFPLLVESRFQGAPLHTGLIIAGASLAAGLSATRLPWLYRRVSRRALLLTAFVLYAVSFWLMGLMPGLWWLLAPIFLYGLGQGLNIPLVSLLLAGQAPDERRAALMAANAVLLRLGQSIGPALFGALAAFCGPAWAIRAGCVIALGMAGLVIAGGLPSSAAYGRHEQSG
jgi:MFS family permease